MRSVNDWITAMVITCLITFCGIAVIAIIEISSGCINEIAYVVIQWILAVVFFASFIIASRLDSKRWRDEYKNKK